MVKPLVVFLSLVMTFAGISACGLGTGKNLTYEQSEDRLRNLIDESLKAGLDGQKAPPKSEIYSELCGDSDTDEYYPHYRYHFPLAQLGPNPDVFVDQVERYWRSENFELDPDDSDPSINGMYGKTDEGLNLHVFVNRRTGMALLAGSGACAPKELRT